MILVAFSHEGDELGIPLFHSRSDLSV